MFKIFDFKGRREARLLELEEKRLLAEAANREALVELLDTVLLRVQQTSAAQTEALTEIAKGIQEHGKALNTWFDTFKAYQGDGESHTIRPADEAEEAEKRETEALRAAGYPAGMSAEESLKWLQEKFGPID